MKKRILSSLVSVFLAGTLGNTLVSCSQDGDTITNVTNIIYQNAQEESTDFVSENLPFYKLSNTPTDMLYARFYNGERYVPYVSIRYFLETHDVFKPVKTSYSDGKYSYEYKVNGKNFPICIDAKNDTIYCAEWAGFNEDTDGEEEDAITEKMLGIIRSYSGQKAQTFDLKKYGMEIYGGADDAYVPLCILNQLFTARNCKAIFYNGKGIYFFDAEKSFVYDNYGNSPWYETADGTLCERPQKLIDLTYNMLCFVHDYCYGHPGYYGFADDGNGFPVAKKVRAADELNFDEMLTAYASDVKTMLKSSSYMEYLKGLSKLLWNTYGDGHTGTQFTNYLQLLNSEQVLELNNYNAGLNTQKNIKNETRAEELKNARKNVPGRTDAEGNPVPFYVLSGGKTAVFTFDSFNIDIDFWKNYYASDYVTAQPNPDNFETIGLTYQQDPTVDFYKALYKLLYDSSYSGVETILIDVSCNSGGDDRCMSKLFAYIVDSPEVRHYDIHTDTRYIRHISADLNMDGKSDDADAEYRKALKQRFKFAVLASRASFSCGNAFPVICADEGIPVLGERTAGGSCAVTYGCTADGFPYVFSNRIRISHKSDWSTIEGGVTITSGGEITDAAEFYNDTKLQQIINNIVK